MSEQTTLSLLLSAATLSAALSLKVLPARGADDLDLGRTPPRLSHVSGEVSFLRPGSGDWTEARVNTPLAPGDRLHTGAGSVLEIQIGSRDYIRADERTEIGVEAYDRDFLQLAVAVGRISFDLHSLGTDQSIELDTPNATLIIEGRGYYRTKVGEETTELLVRRGGRGTVTPLGGAPVALESGTAIIVRGSRSPSVATQAIPAPDAWDGWNEGRSHQLTRSISSQYLSDNTYGAEELDRHGSWRHVPPYGPVWVPRVVAAGWAPYTHGRWLWDGYYGWTWLSHDPWGWAPFHYGRWVYFDGYWAWAPGPRVAVAVYYPALVAFFGEHVSVGIGFGTVGWVALGWGEPIYPWWGRPGFIGRPCWHGWGGPRIVHKTRIVNKTKIIQVDDYTNARHRGGIVVVPRDRFGHDRVEKVRVDRFDRGRLRPVSGRLDIRPAAAPVTSMRLGPNRARRVAGAPLADLHPGQTGSGGRQAVRGSGRSGIVLQPERREAGPSGRAAERWGWHNARVPRNARGDAHPSGLDLAASRPQGIGLAVEERRGSPGVTRLANDRRKGIEPPRGERRGSTFPFRPRPPSLQEAPGRAPSARPSVPDGRATAAVGPADRPWRPEQKLPPRHQQAAQFKHGASGPGDRGASPARVGHRARSIPMERDGRSGRNKRIDSRSQ